jgi:hypothetical protein
VDEFKVIALVGMMLKPVISATQEAEIRRIIV